MVGQTLGHYRIEARLGAGGMGVVYLARDTRLNRPVALKLLSDPSLPDPTVRDDLLREGRAASALNHPSICTVHEVAEADGQMFIVMEYVEGSLLSGVIPVNGLPVELVLRYGIQTADALEHAHEKGVVHGDLKSPNVIVTREGRVKILDFGLAKRAANRSQVGEATTQSRVSGGALSTIAGTLPYLAPEVLRAGPATTSSDIWALGVMLYEISSGELPFRGTTQFDLTAEILRGPVPALPAHVPPAIRDIILRCLAKEPGQRYRRAGEIRAALETVESSVRLAPVATDGVRAGHGWRWAALGLAALGVTAVVVGLLSRQRNPPAWPATAAGGGRLTLVESSERRAFDPALSLDGKMVTYVVETAPRQLDLFVARVAGGARVQLTNDAAREEHPRFSPDGERIVFARRRSADGIPEICIVPTFGGDPAVVVVNAVEPVWSPDSKRLLFIQREAPEQLVLATAAADGSDRQVLLPSGGVYPFLRNPAWSADGSRVAVVRSTGGAAGEIWIVSATGGAPRRISDDPVGVFSQEPVFTSDGRGLVHSSNRGGATNIWFVPLDGAAAVRLTTGAGPDESPTIARDGTIAFVNSRWRATLLLQDLRSGMTRPLLTHAPYLWAPVFSPDMRELAFSRSEVDGSWHIWILPVSGGVARQLTSNPLGEVYPRYMPDGGSVIFQTWGAPHRVWRAPREGGPPVALTPGVGSGEAYADVSPDGQWLAYVRAEERSEHIYVAPIAGGGERLLTRSSGSVPRWSPDGRSIAFSADRGYVGGVFVIGSDGKGERRLTDRGGWPVWWPDGRRVGYRIIGPNGNQQMVSVPVEGGESAPIGAFTFNGVNEPFDISRDGSMVATTDSAHVSDEIWLLQPGR